MTYGTENFLVEKWMEFTKLMRVFWDMTSCTFVDGLGNIVLEWYSAFTHPEDQEVVYSQTLELINRTAW